jgi:general secretion pathway protein D
LKIRFATFIATLLVTSVLLTPLPASAKGVVLNFNDVDISTMVKFISDLTGKNFVMDDRVKGKISVYSPAKLSPEEAFNVFTSVLELKGFTLVQAGKVYKVVPTSAAKQSGMKILTEGERGPVNETYVARVITLEQISAPEAVTFLQPMVSKDGYISSFGPTNMLLVVDSSLNITKLLNIVELIDTVEPREGGEVIFLKNAGADATVAVAREWLASRGKGQKPGAPGAAAAAGASVIADARLNALVVFGTPAEKEEVKKLVALVDVVPPTSSSKVNVYYLENADATEVAKVLEGVVKGSSTSGAPSAPGGAPQQSPFEGGKISLTPDKATNSLVIMASPADYQNLLQVIQKLDKRRRQVFVEAVIAEVSLNKLRDLGVKWGVVGGASNGTVTGVGAFDPLGTFTGSDLTGVLGALKTAGISIPELTGTAVNFAVVLKALETNGIVNVLSTPTILTSDNKEAEIFVGENVPFIGKIDITNANVNAFQSIERKDTGITLKITPQISEGEYVKLDIYQEISSVKTTTTAGASDLITTKRSAKTAVAVKDQETVAIGGLIQDQDQETVNKVPLLGDIPFLGWLFKTKSITRQKTNLMILLTPRIIKSAADLANVSERQRAGFVNAAGRKTPLDIGEELKPKP